MTREGKWPLAALVAAVLAAALLVACGGSDSDSSSSTEAATTGATTTARDGDDGQKGSSSQDGSQDQSAGKGPDSSAEGKPDENKGSNPPKDVATPLEVSGGGSEQFRVKGGDNSVQEYGDESDESELQEVAEIVHGFLVARAEEQWETACSYLSKSIVEQLQQLASQSGESQGTGCGATLEAFTRPVPAAVQREITTVDAGSFRHDDEQGFLIYIGAEGATYAMPMRSEDDAWKVAALSGAALN